MSWEVQCPAGRRNDSFITLAHGEGGRLSRHLIRDVICPCLQLGLDREHLDAAILPKLSGPPVMTTDSFVVSPLFFPGGDIGTLAVYGTVNDLAVAGARPLALSLSLIIEEGLPLATLQRVLLSVAVAAERAHVSVVTGDTKVVPRQVVDQLFLNTTGLGEMIDSVPPGPKALQVGDELVISGPIGRHGVAILAEREQLGFDPRPTSDCGSLVGAVQALRGAAIPIRAMRDATRGGLAAVLHEWAAASDCTLHINESQIPVTNDVRGACELLGLDPLFVACEGTMAVAVAHGCGERSVEALRSCAESSQAAVIGRAVPRGAAPVTIERLLGRQLPLDEPAGLLLPRIC